MELHEYESVDIFKIVTIKCSHLTGFSWSQLDWFALASLSYIYIYNHILPEALQISDKYKIVLFLPINVVTEARSQKTNTSQEVKTTRFL